MQTPWEVANSRLAAGEISVEDHAAIVGRLGPPPLPGAVPTAPPPLPPAQVAGRARWPWVVGIAGLGFVFLVMVGLSSVDGLSIGNLKAEGSSLSFKIANTSSTSGDILLWVEQSGNTMCERVTYVKAKMSYDIRFVCPTLRSGQFTLHPQWASFDPSKIAVAERIE